MSAKSPQLPFPIGADQVKRIKILQKELGMDDDEYRHMLRHNFRKGSCKDLTNAEAVILIRKLTATTRRMDKPSPQGKKYDDLTGRPNYLASPAQLRLIEVLWSQVSRVPRPEQQKALNNFLQRFGVRNIMWLPRAKVAGVKAAIEDMRRKRWGEHKPETVAA